MQFNISHIAIHVSHNKQHIIHPATTNVRSIIMKSARIVDPNPQLSFAPSTITSNPVKSVLLMTVEGYAV